MTKALLKLPRKEDIFNDIYIPLLEDTTRTQIIFGGASSGKSYFEAQRVVKDVAERKRNYLICRNTQNTIRRSVFNEIMKAIKFFKLPAFFKENKTDLVITCANNAQILFCGLDDTEKIKSITPAEGVITDIWVEEATEAERADIKQLEKRLRGQADFPKRLTLTFNPILQNHWIYDEYFGKWEDGKNTYTEDGLLILKTTYKDNKFLTLDDIKALEDETDPYYYNVYTLGNWGVLGSVIFKNWKVEDCTEIRKTADKMKNGLDFGFSSDPAALVHTYYDKTRKRIYILDEIYQTDLTNDMLADEIKQIIDRQYVVCDSAEPKSIKELNNLGVNATGAKKGKDSVNYGIDWLQRQEIIIDPKCQNFKNEIQKYKWKEDKNNNALRVPVDKDNHLLDALRYAYEDEMTESKLIHMDRRALGI